MLQSQTWHPDILPLGIPDRRGLRTKRSGFRWHLNIQVKFKEMIPQTPKFHVVGYQSVHECYVEV